MKTIVTLLIIIAIIIKVLFAGFDSMSSEMKDDAQNRLTKMEQTTE